MQLILWRHADAEDEAVSDLARALTPKGQRQATRMADWFMAQVGVDLTRWKILVSPALRAQQTAAALATKAGIKFETFASIAPEATSDAILQAARWPDSATHVMVVGHQPTLGLVIAQLLSGHHEYISADSVSVKKGAMWWFESRAKGRDKNHQAILRVMTTPESLS